MILNNLFESRYGAAAGVETIRQLVHAVKNSQDIDLKVGPEMFPVSYGDARYLLQYWKANREGGDATAEYFGDANWIEAKLAKRDHTMSPDRLKDMDQERMKSKDYDRMVGIEEYDTRPRDKQDKEAKLKALQTLLVAPTTIKDPEMQRAIQARLAQLQESEETEYQLWWNGEEIDSFASKEEAVAMQKEYEMAYKGGVSIKKAKVKESFFDPHEKKIPSPTSDNPVTKRVEEGYPADYKGWKYDIEYIEDEDTRKKLHSATKDGKRVSIDWSPYSNMTDEQFKTWIDLGMPGRKDVNSIGPLHPEDLEQLMKTKLGTRARLAQEGKPTDIELDVLKYTDEQVAKAITIARGSDGDMTGATDRIEAIANGLSNHSDVAKVLKIANEAKDDDITKKLDPKTKELEEGSKRFKSQSDIGQAKYVVNFHDGKKKHNDGSDSFDIKIFNNKIDRDKFIQSLKQQDYIEEEKMNEAEFEITYQAPQFSKPRTHTIKAVNAKSAEQKFLSFGNPYKIIDIKKAEKVNEEQYSDFEVMRAIKVAQDYHDDITHAIEKIDAIKPGLSNHRAVKDELRRQNEDKDDITKKLDPKTKVALKKAQMKSAGLTKGDPIASLAYGLEKDVDRLDKENDQEEADIASQELVDKYHSQELEALKKSLTNILRK